MTPAQLIDSKGGSTAFAKAIGSAPGAVRLMKHRGKLPRSVWPEVMKAFPDVTLDQLLETETAAPPPCDAHSNADAGAPA